MAEPFPLSPTLWAATAPQPPATPRIGDSIRADVCIVGAGPSGIGAALACQKHGLSFAVIEREKPFNTIQNYPKHKHVFSEPRDFGNSARFPFQDRELLGWVFSQFLYGEVTGIQVGHWIHHAPDLESARFLALQCSQELAHVRLVRRIFDRLETEPQPAHIHEGTCDDLNPEPAFPLQDVVDGRSETDLDITLDDLALSTYAVNVHKSAAESDLYVACGDITTVSG